MGTKSSFEDAAFALAQALAPNLHLTREQIPYSLMRNIIGEAVNGFRKRSDLAPSSASVFGNTNGKPVVKTEERNGGSTMEVSDDSCSRVSFEENMCPRTKSIVRASILERSSALASSNSLKKGTPKRVKLLRKMVATRARRSDAVRTEEFIPIECSESELPAKFSSVYNEILSSHSNPVLCFHIIANTLTSFFGHVTWTCNVEKLVNEFILSTVVKTSAELLDQFSDGTKTMEDEKRIMEYEVHVLLELRALRARNAIDCAGSDVLNKLRFISFASDCSRVKKLLDECVCDLFAKDIPELLVEVYKDLSLSLPCDLEEFVSPQKIDVDTGVVQSFAEVVTPPRPSVTAEKSAKQVANLKRMLNEDSDDGESSSSRVHSSSADDIVARSQTSASRRSSGRSSRVPRRLLQSPPKDVRGTPRKLKRRSTTVPETPESQVKKKAAKAAASAAAAAAEEVDEESDCVPQTPFPKMHKFAPSGNAGKFSELLRETMKRKSMLSARVAKAAKLRQAKALKDSPPRRMSRDIFLSAVSEETPPSPVQSSSSSNNCHPSHSVRVNLQQKFARSVPSTSTESPPSAAVSPRTKCKSDFSIDRGVIEKYRRRLDGIRQCVRKADKNEIFYGRCTVRRNLFEEEENAESGVSTRAASNATLQKNRSGRSVHTNCVYMAHALLNVHNVEPLSPTKAPKHSPFKLHRLVRPATKSDRRRLSKLRIRIQRERVGLPASILSSPVVETPSSRSSTDT